MNNWRTVLIKKHEIKNSKIKPSWKLKSERKTKPQYDK